MPEFPGRLRPPRLAAAPAAPVKGELYFDTTTNVLYWHNGTSWVAATSAGAIFPRTYKDMTDSATTGVPTRT